MRIIGPGRTINGCWMCLEWALIWEMSAIRSKHRGNPKAYRIARKAILKAATTMG